MWGFYSLKDVLEVVLIPSTLALIAPWITQRWQNIQRDAQIKTELVAEISELVMTTVMAVYLFKTRYRNRIMTNDALSRANYLLVSRRILPTHFHEEPLSLCARSRTALAAENLFLRKQLAFYQERQVRPRRFDNASRWILVLLSYGFAWKEALVNVTPQTFIGWHRAGFRLFWRWKSRSGRPRIPPELCTLIRAMARDNPGWGEEHIAHKLLLKFGIQLSPRTVRKYTSLPRGPAAWRSAWSTFVANHAKGVVACDFLTVVTATFKCLYVLVIIELGTRKLLHIHVTGHPTAAWTQQRLRKAIPSDHDYHFLIHDRDAIFSSQLDQSISHMGLRVLRTPYQSPKANSFCERLIGTLRRECLDYLIPLTDNHLCRPLKTWQAHYNHSRPHSSLGPGIPDPPAGLPVTRQEHRHRIPDRFQVVSHPTSGWLAP